MENNEGEKVLDMFKSYRKHTIRVAILVFIAGYVLTALCITAGLLRNKIDLPALKAEQNKEFRASGFSERYYRIGQEIDKGESKGIFFGFGGFIFIATNMISLSVLASANQRAAMVSEIENFASAIKETSNSNNEGNNKDKESNKKEELFKDNNNDGIKFN